MSGDDYITQNGVFGVGVSKAPTTINSVQSVQSHITGIVAAIDASNATASQKAEARSKLREFIENPLVVAVIGAAIGGIVFK